MSYKEIIDNVSNIEDLDNTTILKVLEKFSKTIKDFAIEQSGLNNLVNVEFIPSDNNTTYTGDSVDYLGTLKLTLSDNIIVNKPCNIKFNIKGSNTIVVDVDEFNNSLELHLDNSVVTTLAFAESERQKSKNLLSYPYVSGSTTISGVSFSCNSDGSLTVTGTSTSAIFYTLLNGKELKQGNYTFSVRDDNGQFITNYAVQIYDEDENLIVSAFTPKSFSLSKNIFARIVLKINSNLSFNGKYYLQLEEGSVATDYQPYNGAIVHEKQIADVEHIEVLYDKTSSDANINKGLTSGIPFDNTTELNLGANLSSKYKGTYVYITIWNTQVRCYCDISYGQSSYSFMGADPNTGAQSIVSGRVTINNTTGILKGTKLLEANLGGNSYTSITDGKYNIYKVEGVLR